MTSLQIKSLDTKSFALFCLVFTHLFACGDTLFPVLSADGSVDTGVRDAGVPSTTDAGDAQTSRDADAALVIRDAEGNEDAARSDATVMDGQAVDAQAADVRAVDAQADAQTGDVQFVDGSANDAGPLDGALDSGVSIDGGCNPTDMGDPNKARVVAVGLPFAAQAGAPGTSIRTFSLSPTGILADDGIVFDVGVEKPTRLLFTPDGKYLLVLGEYAALASVRVDGPSQMTIADTIMLPGGGYNDLQVRSDGQTFFATSYDSSPTGGIHTIHVDCNGQLTWSQSEFSHIPLSSTLALLPQDRAVLLGGELQFEPIEPRDVRLLQFAPSAGWTELGAFDIFTANDGVDAKRIAASPDGTKVVIPNGNNFESPDTHQASVIDASGNTLREIRRVQDVLDAREAMFSADNQTVLISLFYPGQVVVLADRGSGWEIVQRIRGIGTAEQMDQVRRGNLVGRVLIPSTDPSGALNIAQLQITGPGAVNDLGQLNFAEQGSENIPDGIAIQP